MADLGRGEITANMQDPPDKKRMKEMDKLAKKAAAGDQAALLRLQALSGYDAKKEGGLNGVDPYADLRDDFKGAFGKQNTGAATADAQNYARMLVADLTGSEVPNYLPPKDAYIGDTIGKVLKIAAPIAGALIPGVGMLGAAAIGAGGNALGQYAGTGKVNIGQAALSGGLAAGGNALLGNGLGSTAAQGGAVGYTPTSVVEGAAGAGSGGAAGLPTALGKGLSLNGVLGTLGKAAPLIAGGMGAIGAGKLGSQAEDLRNQAARIALTDYQGRKPFRDAALEGLMGPQPQREDLSGLFSDPSNPYRRPVPRPGA